MLIRFGPNADAWHWLGQPSPTSVATLGFHPRQPDDVFSFLRVSFPSVNRSGRDRKENVRQSFIFIFSIYLYVVLAFVNISCYNLDAPFIGHVSYT